MNKRTLILFFVIILLAACKPAPAAAPTAAPPSIPLLGEAYAEIPDEARIAVNWGDPRPPGYWALWNACAEDNRADVAEANGGREAGWVLMDDLIESPGIQIGDLQISSCPQGLAVLTEEGAAGEEKSLQIYRLAALMLAAELNLNLGAESCPIAEEIVLGGHILLAEVGFNGSGDYTDEVADERLETIAQVVELLQFYNRGDLCIDPGN